MASYIFQGTPDKFDIDGYLNAAVDQDRIISWSVTRHKDRIKKGDTVFLWRAAGKDKGDAGVVGQAVCVSDVMDMVPDAFTQEYWSDPPVTEPRVELELEAVNTMSKSVIKKKWVEEDPLLSSLQILKQPSGTNWLITDVESQRLEVLLSRTGVNWTRTESLAALWLYKNLYGKPISKLPGSPVANTAMQIGRAVTGVYNKVMNFRSLDPSVDEKGFDRVGATDRLLWDTYFDAKTNSLNLAELNQDYELVWSAGAEEVVSDIEGESLPPEAADDKKSAPPTPPKSPRFGRGGQTAFKKRLMYLYDGKCAISGVGVEAVLIAAHIVDHAATGNNHSRNGLLLRADLHNLFDAGLLVVDPEALEISIADALSDTDYYREFHGKKLRDRMDGSRPSADFLNVKNRTSG